jgi:hypothetical protein
MGIVEATKSLRGVFALAAFVLGVSVRAHAAPLLRQDFEAYATTSPGATVIAMPDDWVRCRAAVTTNNVPDAAHGDRVGNITAYALPILRYWSSPAITGHVGTLTFDTSLYRVTETNPVVDLVVFLSETNASPSNYTAQASITVTTTNWTRHTVAFNQYGVTNKYLVIGRDRADSGSYRVQLDNLVLEPAPGAAAPVSISEFVADNGGCLRTQAGDAADWIELRNHRADAFDIGGWHLTDRATAPTKWRFPDGTVIGPNGYLIVFADSSPASVVDGELHANFSLSKDGEYLGLSSSTNNPRVATRPYSPCVAWTGSAHPSMARPWPR